MRQLSELSLTATCLGRGWLRRPAELRGFAPPSRSGTLVHAYAVTAQTRAGPARWFLPRRSIRVVVLPLLVPPRELTLSCRTARRRVWNRRCTGCYKQGLR